MLSVLRDGNVKKGFYRCQRSINKQWLRAKPKWCKVPWCWRAVLI